VAICGTNARPAFAYPLAGIASYARSCDSIDRSIDRAPRQRALCKRKKAKRTTITVRRRRYARRAANGARCTSARDYALRHSLIPRRDVTFHPKGAPTCTQQRSAGRSRVMQPATENSRTRNRARSDAGIQRCESEMDDRLSDSRTKSRVVLTGRKADKRDKFCIPRVMPFPVKLRQSFARCPAPPKPTGDSSSAGETAPIQQRCSDTICNGQSCADDLCLTAKTELHLTVLVTGQLSVLFCLFIL